MSDQEAQGWFKTITISPLHKTSLFSGPRNGFKLFVKHILYVNSICIVTSKLCVDISPKFIFAHGPKMSSTSPKYRIKNTRVHFFLTLCTQVHVCTVHFHSYCDDSCLLGNNAMSMPQGGLTTLKMDIGQTGLLRPNWWWCGHRWT
jgi:hypothetical protein